MLAVKAAASHELLQKLLDAYAAEPDAAEIEVLLCGMCEQEGCCATAAPTWRSCTRRSTPSPGSTARNCMTEGQIAILPAGHPLAARKTLSLADISDVPDLPLARWPRHGDYPPGPGPEIHDQTQLAQLIALGRTVAVLPDSARAWLWAEHTAVPLTDAPPVVTHIAWPAHSRSLALAGADQDRRTALILPVELGPLALRLNG